MPKTPDQEHWVARVLGVTPGAGEPAPSMPASAIWTRAKDEVDGQLNALYGVLRKTGLPVFATVAGEIEQVLRGYRVKLLAGLMEYEQSAGPGRDKAKPKVLATVAEYRSRLTQDGHVLAADTNPFGAAVKIRATLGKALDDIERQLA